MKLTFAYKTLETTPRGYARVRLVREPVGSQRLVREGEILWLELGSGKPQSMNRRKFVLLCRSIVRAARELKIKKVAVQFDLTPELFKNLQDISPEEVSSIAAQNFEMANYEFVSHKTKPKEGWSDVEELAVCGRTYPSIEKAAKKGLLIGQEVNACRQLSNTPGGDMTPKILAAAAKKAVAGTKATVKVLGRKEMTKLGMGAILGIAKGSSEEPQFIVMEYTGGEKSQRPVVLIGKGVTFDTGGLNLKPGDHMYEMHMDMSGGAAVIHAVALAAKLGIKTNVVGLIPAVENAPGTDAVRPGDILKSLSGKTIEVVNTDAEGRVIMADAFTYSKRYDPRWVVDAATLTGAALSALGLQCSAVMASEQKFEDSLRKLGEESGDYVWPFPLWEEYESMVKSDFADIPNIPTSGNSRYGGVIAGGMFLREFAKELNCPWAHLDIAPRMTSAPGDFLAKGAAGAPVRLFLKLIESYASTH
jgi:leucyl aminopeptidase